jgi:hypothetical protein
MRYLIVFVFLFAAQFSRAQSIVGCEQLLATPVGNETAEQIVSNCKNFIYCGVDSQDWFNCVKVQVMGMLIFEAKEENPKYTYGDLLEKLKEYTAKPSYVAFKARQERLLTIIDQIVTNENWKDAQSVLIDNGIKQDDLPAMKRLFDKNAFENWTYAQLLHEYANSEKEIQY